MNIVDVLIILVILFGGIIGFKNGFTKQLVSFVGFILVVILSFVFKNPVSQFFYSVLPFFKFGGVLKGVTVLNIALYEIMAFLVVLLVLMVILRILLKITGLIEKILKFTIILGIPSKILGAIVGLIEYSVVVFIALYIISLPFFDSEIIGKSKYKDKILNNMPILSGYVDNTVKVLDEFIALKDEYTKTSNANEFNLKGLDLFLKYDVITVESTDKLIKSGKLKIDGVDEVLDKYRKN